jgi:hypothetical protein
VAATAYARIRIGVGRPLGNEDNTMKSRMLTATLMLLGPLLAACGQQAAPAPAAPAAPTNPLAPSAEPPRAEQPATGASPLAGTAWQVLNSWQPVLVPATRYDASQPPGPVGLPEHIQILFGAATVADRQPGTPVMYIIPVNAYTQLWDGAKNPAVSAAIDNIFKYTASLADPAPTRGMPALPPEEES